MATIFESAEQSSSTEFSDELTTALAAGRWWAIMEVSDPISEDAEYGDLIPGQWGGTVEAKETSMPTSLVFSDASEAAHSQHSGFSDAKLKITPQWRQKMMQGATFLSRSTQGAPVPTRSTQGAPVPTRSTQGAPVPTRSTQGAPVPPRSTQGAPVPTRFEKGDLTSSHVFSNASKTTRQWRKQRPGKYEEGELKTTKQWRQQTPKAPVPDRSRQGECMLVRSQQSSPSSKKEDLTSSLVFSDASKKAQHSSFSDATMATDQRRNWRQKKPQIASVPAASLKEAPVPIGSQQRGKLRIPEHLTKHLIKASFEMPMPIQSLQRAPVAASKELTHSSHGAPMQDKIGARPKLQIPEPEIAPVCCSKGALIIDKISERRDPKNPELLRHLQNGPVLVSSANLRIPRQQREKLREEWGQKQRQKNIQKGVSVPAKTPHTTLAPPCSPQQPPRSPQGAAVSRWSRRVCLWSTEASDNAGLSQAPPQKLCVELKCYNHPAPQITTSQPNWRTQNRLQPRSQPTRKRALDSAGLDRSPPQKKQRMAIKVNNQQLISALSAACSPHRPSPLLSQPFSESLLIRPRLR
ncbi:uncharacterized protein LOC143736508 [Siphateles boraxobius]|uniref:uncharacterized protein LOC143736508 n=1 Tax=Siphateles boraxobius TaxID=180520 RepID=UPI0040649D24